MNKEAISIDPEIGSKNVLCLYEVDFLLTYERLSSWLEEEKDRYLLFFSQECESAQSAFLFLSQSPKVFCYLISPENEREVFTYLSWKFVFLTWYFSFSEQENKRKEIEFFSRLASVQSSIHLLASEYADFGKKVFANIFTNISSLSDSIPLSLLKGSCANIPAVICGAGPSLEKAIPLFKEQANKALIFAGGSAISVLSHFSVNSHFNASFDPDPPYHRFAEQTAFESPFFYQARVSSDLLGLVHGQKMIVPANFGYFLEEWILQNVDKGEGSFDGGWVVGNFLVAIAAYLGCNPIILVGMDLCFPPDKMYAEGVNEVIDLTKVVPCVNAQEEKCLTKPDWLVAAKWLEEFILHHPDIQLINTSASGIRIQGAKEEPLGDALLKQNSFDMQGHIHASLRGIDPHHFLEENLFQMWERTKNELQESMQKVDLLCDQMLDNIGKNYPNFEKAGAENIVLELDIEQEVFFTLVIRPFWDVWRHVFQREENPQKELGMLIHKILFYKKMTLEFSRNFVKGGKDAGGL